jgi:hypothetical protein
MNDAEHFLMVAMGTFELFRFFVLKTLVAVPRLLKFIPAVLTNKWMISLSFHRHCTLILLAFSVGFSLTNPKKSNSGSVRQFNDGKR